MEKSKFQGLIEFIRCAIICSNAILQLGVLFESIRCSQGNLHVVVCKFECVMPQSTQEEVCLCEG